MSTLCISLNYNIYKHYASEMCSVSHLEEGCLCYWPCTVFRESNPEVGVACQGISSLVYLDPKFFHVVEDRWFTPLFEITPQLTKQNICRYTFSIDENVHKDPILLVDKAHDVIHFQFSFCS